MKHNTRRRKARKGRDLAGTCDRAVVDHWNGKHAIGAHVRFWRALPSGPTLDTATRSEAFLDPAGQAVIFVHGVTGYVSLYHLLVQEYLAAEAPPFELGAEWGLAPIEECHCCVCGCTEDEPCEGGCYWVEDSQMRDRCSSCVGKPVPRQPPMRLTRLK